MTTLILKKFYILLLNSPEHKNNCNCILLLILYLDVCTACFATLSRFGACLPKAICEQTPFYYFWCSDFNCLAHDQIAAQAQGAILWAKLHSSRVWSWANMPAGSGNERAIYRELERSSRA